MKRGKRRDIGYGSTGSKWSMVTEVRSGHHVTIARSPKYNLELSLGSSRRSAVAGRKIPDNFLSINSQLLHFNTFGIHRIPIIMSTAAVRERSSSAEEAPRKKPKRTYRACYPCRSVSDRRYLRCCGWPIADCSKRKLKCNFGEDPNRPWNGPCLRCIREQRECVRSMPTVVRYSLPGADGVIAFPHELASGSATTATSTRPTVITTSTGEVQPTRTHSKSTFRNEYQGPSPRDDHFDDAAMDAHHHGRAETPPSSGGDDGGSALVSSNLQNPNDALKLLASASSLRYRNHEENHGSPSEPIPDGIKGNASPWLSWSPIAEGHLTEQEGGALLCL